MKKSPPAEPLKAECRKKRSELLSLLNRVSQEITRSPHSLDLPDLEEDYEYTYEQLSDLSNLLDEHLSYLKARYGGQLAVKDRQKNGEKAFFIRYVFFDTEHDIALFLYDNGAAHLTLTRFERDEDEVQHAEEHDYDRQFSVEEIATIKRMIDNSSIFDAPVVTAQGVDPITSILVEDGARRLVTRFAKDVEDDADYQSIEQELKRIIGIILSKAL